MPIPATPAAAAAQPASRRPPGFPIFGIPLRVIKPLLFLVCLFPMARWMWLGLHDGLTANPVEFLTRSSGLWTLTALMITLSVTPLRLLFKEPGVLQLRRMLGLFTFFYACLHLTTYVWWDQWFDVVSILKDVAQRPFILVGFTAWLLLIPLAVTSTQGWMRRLKRCWAVLHRVIYGIGALVLLHFWWQKAGKNDFDVVLVYVGVFAVLMAFRIWERVSPARRPRRRPPGGQA